MWNQKQKSTDKRRVCQGCIELFERTEIYIARKTDHSIFLCGPCLEESGLEGKLEKEPKTKKTKKVV